MLERQPDCADAALARPKDEKAADPRAAGAESAGIASAPITAQGGGHLSAKASAPGRLLGFDYIAAISEKSAFLREKTVSCGNYAELNLATQARESQPKPSTTLNLSQCLCSGINEDV